MILPRFSSHPNLDAAAALVDAGVSERTVWLPVLVAEQTKSRLTSPPPLGANGRNRHK
jgi:hypothetical protein